MKLSDEQVGFLAIAGNAIGDGAKEYKRIMRALAREVLRARALRDGMEQHDTDEWGGDFEFTTLDRDALAAYDRARNGELDV